MIKPITLELDKCLFLGHLRYNGTMVYVKHSHCSYCGNYYGHLGWPRTCPNCKRTTYLNPSPVAVVLLPFEKGLLLIRRGEKEGYGELALPGGFIESGESWEKAAAREVQEEIGLKIDETQISHFWTASSNDGMHLLIFGIISPLKEMPLFQPTHEALELLLVEEPVTTAFQLHSLALQRYFQMKKLLVG